MSGMEIPFIPQTSAQKLEGSKPQPVSARKAAGAYSAAKSGADAIQISSKSKLMQKLRASYSELEKSEPHKTADVKSQVESKSIENKAEDVVNGILRGTLFETL